MSDKLKEFVRETIDELLESLPAEEIRKRLSTEELLEGLPAEQLLKGLSAEERLKGLSTEEMIQALSPDARAALVQCHSCFDGCCRTGFLARPCSRTG